MAHANHERLMKNTIFLYFRLIVTLSVSLYTSRVVLNAVGIDNYGIHNVVAGAVAMVAFMNGAIAGATQRFISFEYGKGASTDRLIRVFSTAFFLHIGIAVFILMSGIPFGFWMIHNVLNIPQARIDAAEWVLVCAVCALMSQVVISPFTALILSRERLKVYAYMSLLDAAIKLTIAFMLSLGECDRLKLYAILLLLGTLLLNTVYMAFCRLSFDECRLTRAMEWQKAREMGSFVGWSLSSHIAAMLGNQGVNVLLNVYFGPAVNAARGIAMQASGTIQGFVSNLQVASAPQIVKSYSGSEFESLRDLIIFSSKITLFLFIIIGVPIFIEASQVLELWLGSSPPHASLFLQLLMAKAMIDCSAEPLYQAIMATGKIKKYNLLVCGVIAAGFVVSFYFLAAGRRPGIIFHVSIVVSVVLVLVRLSFLRNSILLSMREYARKIVVPTVFILVSGSLIPIIFHLYLPDGLPRLAWVFASSFVCIPLAAFALGTSPEERYQMNRKIVKCLGINSRKA